MAFEIMRTSKNFLILGVSIAFLCPQAFAERSSEIERGRALTVACLGCHGEQCEGQGSLPSLRTLDREAFIQRFQAYMRDDTAPSVMHRIARGYSTHEVRLMADFLTQRCPG